MAAQKVQGEVREKRCAWFELLRATACILLSWARNDFQREVKSATFCQFGR